MATRGGYLRTGEFHQDHSNLGIQQPKIKKENKNIKKKKKTFATLNKHLQSNSQTWTWKFYVEDKNEKQKIGLEKSLDWLYT